MFFWAKFQFSDIFSFSFLFPLFSLLSPPSSFLFSLFSFLFPVFLFSLFLFFFFFPFFSFFFFLFPYLLHFFHFFCLFLLLLLFFFSRFSFLFSLFSLFVLFSFYKELGCNYVTICTSFKIVKCVGVGGTLGDLVGDGVGWGDFQRNLDFCSCLKKT